ncbi:MAG: hypothetical protein K6L81_17630 [Agarilytica sp.]
MTSDNYSANTYVQAKAANESIKAQKARRQLKQLENQFVDRDKTILITLELARDSRARWLAWADSITDDLAESLDVDKTLLHDLLQKGVQLQLEELGEFSFTLENTSVES